MQEYMGAMSGIGDVLNKRNLITPEFDARITNFIIGANAILDGFQLKNGVLTAGACVVNGYVGAYNQNIDASSNLNYIYAKFVVNHNPNIPDSFSIILSDTELNQKLDDILHEKGEVIVPLYMFGNKMMTAKFPQNAYRSVTAKEVVPYGKLLDGVTAVTKSVTVENNTVATTKYVKDKIVAEFGDETLSLQNQWGGEDDYCSVNLQYRAKFVLGSILVHYSNGATIPTNTTLFTLPSKFCPKKELSISGRRGVSFVLGKITTDGNVIITSTDNSYKQEGSASYSSGYIAK